jgi:hypothetical protein
MLGISALFIASTFGLIACTMIQLGVSAGTPSTQNQRTSRYMGSIPQVNQATLPMQAVASPVVIWQPSPAPTATATPSGSYANIDFSNTVRTASPDTLGGNSMAVNTSAAQLQEENALGLTMSRFPLATGTEVPNASLSGYQQALAAGCPSGSMCDPNTWNWSYVDQMGTMRANGYKVIGIYAGARGAWLAYPGDQWSIGCPNHCFPQDWNVFEDVVKKEVQHFAPDYAEAWTEPDLYAFGAIDPDTYASTVFYHIAHAVKAANSKVSVCGPVTSGPNGSYLSAMAGTSSIQNWINCISYHSYGSSVDVSTEASLAQAYWPNLPVLLTEWNWDGNCQNFEDGSGSKAVPFCGATMAAILESPLTATTHYSFAPGTQASSRGGTTCTVWNGTDASATLLPKAYNWNMALVQLGLRNGPFTVKAASTNGTGAGAAGGINSAGDLFAFFPNWTNAQTVTVNFNNISNGNYTLEVWLVDNGGKSAQSPIENTSVIVSYGALSHKISMTAYSVAGVIMTQQ